MPLAAVNVAKAMPPPVGEVSTRAQGMMPQLAVFAAPFWPTTWPLFPLLPKLAPLPVNEAAPLVLPVAYTPRLAPRMSSVAPALRENIELAVEFTATVKGWFGSGVKVITPPPFWKFRLLPPWLISSVVAVVELPRTFKLPPLRKIPRPPRRLLRFALVLSSVRFAPGVTWNVVALATKPPAEPVRSSVPRKMFVPPVV